jgi:hypothetical protein
MTAGDVIDPPIRTTGVTEGASGQLEGPAEEVPDQRRFLAGVEDVPLVDLVPLDGDAGGLQQLDLPRVVSMGSRASRVPWVISQGMVLAWGRASASMRSGKNR